VPSNPIHALLVSASLGALIGLVRQWSYEREHHGQTAKAGLRTFTTWSLLGCAAALLEQQGATWALGATLLAFTAVLATVHFGDHNRATLGLTTISVGLVTFTAGALAGYALYVPAMMLGVGVMLILGSKHWSHAWTRRWKPEDVNCLLQFAAITGIVLPLAPNEDIGPDGSFNPYKIWLMVVMVASLGFLGYATVRWLGERAGMMVTGLAGGLASSTATTLALSKQSRATPALNQSLALAVVLACTVMLPRMTVMMAMVSPKLALASLGPLALMALPGIVWGLWEWYYRVHPKHTVNTPALANPLNLTVAIKFGAVYAVVRFLVKIASGSLNPTWVYGVSFIAGLTDTAAISLSSAQAVVAGTLSATVATKCVVIGALSNTLVKAGLAFGLGAPEFRRAIAWALGGVFVAGLIGLWLF
jgi:uncharacterized membrane protein (DUF4010 family)